MSGIREGDIEALRNRAKLEGRPIKSRTVIDKNGDRVHYLTNKKGRVKILGKDK
jgi:hypothetical protein